MAKCKQVDRPSKKRPQTASESGAVLQNPECHRRVSPGTVASSVFEQRRQDKLFIMTVTFRFGNQDCAQVGWLRVDLVTCDQQYVMSGSTRSCCCSSTRSLGDL